jgi:RecJ-like exonuclease
MMGFAMPTLEEAKREAAENVYFAGPMGMEATFDRVLVVEDEFRSGYECDVCSQSGKVQCPECAGQGSYLKGTLSIKCSACGGTGKVKCPDCNGIGVHLEIPEVAKRRPTTGLIVSIGNEVKQYQRGDYAAYPNFCGEVWELSGIDHQGNESTIVLRMMKERELLCRVTGHLSLKRMKGRNVQTSG